MRRGHERLTRRGHLAEARLIIVMALHGGTCGEPLSAIRAKIVSDPKVRFSVILGV